MRPIKRFVNRYTMSFALFALLSTSLLLWSNPFKKSVLASYPAPLSPAPMAAPTELFFSEYIEGSSNNKAIEIYNGTGSAINLATENYVLQQFFNGSTTAGLNISLTGTVAAGDVYVVAQASAAAAILAQADQTSGSGFFNGDDAIVLRKGGTSGTIVDVIGQVGNDPGTEWGTGLTSTADNTLRRKAAICAGDTNPSDPFDPAIEWDGFATDTFDGLGSHTATCGGGNIISINDVPVTEGDSGTVTATFTVSLTAPAGAGGVTFDIATQDNTATVANNDYVMKSLTGQNIPAGSSTYAFSVTVNGDMMVEPNETFFVNVTNITGATAGDTQGLGTINNDDVTITPIHDIQGPGASSPIVGASVTTRGIVTGRKSNGFFIQEPDATVDADPMTSEGIFVFTSSAPPAAAAVGNLAQVTGTVAEFVPTADPLQPPLTELTSPSVVQISTGNPLPAAIPLTATFPNPAGVFDQLERVEGMRVSAASLTVVGPSAGNLSEANATSTERGDFSCVITSVARPFREPGIQAPDPAPMGTIPPIPRFDTNPETIVVDSNGLTGTTAIAASTGAVLTNIVGPLDYGFRRYTILPEVTIASLTGGMTPTAVNSTQSNEFTVAGFNLQRFFDMVDDPGISDVALTVTAFNNRLNKASLAIRNFLNTPDILCVVEVENLTALQAIANKINTDAGMANPMYTAHLIEGNDIGGIDVGFLIKTSVVTGATPRVTVGSVVQENAGELFVNPNSSTELLNDRPTLRLEATINFANGAAFPITVLVNHLRSLNGVDDPGPGSNGWPTAGERVRAKRQKQAESLANLIQALQMANPNKPMVVIGDFNAFEFNDGYGDSMNVIQGTPPPDNQTVVPGDGIDLVNPNLDNLFDTAPAAERYSFVFDGNAQSLDHLLVNAAMIANTSAQRVEHPRINADFNDTARNDPNSALRLSDHDPIVGFFALPNCEITCPSPVTQGNDTGQCGAVVTYTSPTTSGNCTSVSCSPPSGSFFPVGVTTVNCMDNPALDKSGSARPEGLMLGQCSFTVTVNDTQAPGITCPAPISTGTATGACTAVVNYDAPTVMDNCPGVGAPTCSPASGSTFPVGITTVNCSVSDAAGNAAKCSFTITVSDEEAPTINCPANIIIVTPNGNLSGVATFSVTALDNCATVTPVCNPPSGASFPVGTTTVTCTASDGANTATCSFTVTAFDGRLQDDTVPTRVVIFNTITGEYRFCCDAMTLVGQASSIIRKGGEIMLQDNRSDRRVIIRVSKAIFKGTATANTLAPPNFQCQIQDRDTRDDTSLCIGAQPARSQ